MIDKRIELLAKKIGTCHAEHGLSHDSSETPEHWAGRNWPDFAEKAKEWLAELDALESGRTTEAGMRR
jgi:hypothetical protein